jgi:hypothetical protein
VSDPFDDDLAAVLRNRVGSLDSSELTTSAAHDAVLARARGIRRRRAAVTGAAAMAAVVLGGFFLLRGGDEQTLVPADPPSTPSTRVPSSEAPTTQAPDTQAATTLPQTTQPSTSVATTVPGTTVVTTSAPTSPPSPTTETYRSAGGSITVSWDGSSLRLLSVDPAAEHESEIEDETAVRIRVRFRGPNDSRIEVRVENGAPTVDIV